MHLPKQQQTKKRSQNMTRAAVTLAFTRGAKQCQHFFFFPQPPSVSYMSLGTHWLVLHMPLWTHLCVFVFVTWYTLHKLVMHMPHKSPWWQLQCVSENWTQSYNHTSVKQCLSSAHSEGITCVPCTMVCMDTGQTCSWKVIIEYKGLLIRSFPEVSWSGSPP